MEAEFGFRKRSSVVRNLHLATAVGGRPFLNRVAFAGTVRVVQYTCTVPGVRSRNIVDIELFRPIYSARPCRRRRARFVLIEVDTVFVDVLLAKCVQ